MGSHAHASDDIMVGSGQGGATTKAPASLWLAVHIRKQAGARGSIETGGVEWVCTL